MIPASARLHAAIVEQRLTLPDDAELAATPPTPSRAIDAAAGGSTSRTRAPTSTR
jgi:hypothetical protein